MKHILKLARGYWNTYKYLFNLFRGYYAYPYIKSVIIVIVSIFCLAILIQICKEVGFLPAQKIFDFLNQWAIVLSASVMLMLAGAAVWAIMDNRHGRIVDRRERLLNEIIEWAEDVARLNFKIFNFIEAQISKESWIESGIGEIVSQFQVVETKGVYMNSIAISSFKEDKKLSKAVKAVNKEIRGLADVSVKRLDKEVTSEIVTEHVNLLRVKITDLLKETAKIKTRDIS